MCPSTLIDVICNSIELKKSHILLRTYSAEPLVVVGEVYVQVLYKEDRLALRLIMVSGDGPSEWLSEMEIDWKTLCQQSQCGNPLSSLWWS